MKRPCSVAGSWPVICLHDDEAYRILPLMSRRWRNAERTLVDAARWDQSGWDDAEVGGREVGAVVSLLLMVLCSPAWPGRGRSVSSSSIFDTTQVLAGVFERRAHFCHDSSI
jgi:hypothetical protein